MLPFLMISRPSIEGFTLLATDVANSPLHFQSLPGCSSRNCFLFKLLHCCPGVVAGIEFSIFTFLFRFPLSPLECALMSKHPVLPGFGRSRPSVTSLESALTQIASVSPLECALTKKGGGGYVFRRAAC